MNRDRMPWRKFYRAKRVLRDKKASAIANSDARLLLERQRGWTKKQCTNYEGKGRL